MNIAIASAFRNNAGFHINRYFRQIARLATVCEVIGHDLHLKLVWGDSKDATRDELYNCAVAMLGTSVQTFELIERSHGGPVYGSTEDPARLKALSFVANGAFESIGAAIDAVIWVESDLLWEPMAMARLVARLRPGAGAGRETPPGAGDAPQNGPGLAINAPLRGATGGPGGVAPTEPAPGPGDPGGPGVDIVAPLVFARDAFYDIWGFRSLADERYGPFHPYNRDLRHDGQLTEVSSVGSCVVMRGEVARRCRIRNEYCLVGFCQDARAEGFRVWVDASEKVVHP